MEVSESLRNLLWSLWAELGVPGWTRVHQDWWIDPEALLLFTAEAADLDARLREETSEWVVRYAHLLSGSRMKNLLRRSEALRIGIAKPHAVEFLSRIQAHTSLRLPVARRGTPLELRRSQQALDVSRPAQLSLKLRSILGVGARSEVLRFFLSEGKSFFSVRHLVEEDVGFTKRAIQLVLDDLVLARVLTRKARGNSAVYLLEKPAQLEALVGEIPPFAPRWRSLFEILSTLRVLEKSCHEKASAQALSTRTLARKLDSAAEEAGLPRIPHEVRGEAFLGAFECWTGKLLRDLVAGRSSNREALLKEG